MRKRKQVRVVGIVQRKENGRPEIAYGRRCPADKIEHEIRVTDLELLLDCKIHRGVKVGKAEPDGAGEIHGRTCFIEVDNSGKMTVKQMQAKWKRYGQVEGFILIVCMTEGRMKRLITGADQVKDVALFTTFDRLRAGQPWTDCQWKTASL